MKKIQIGLLGLGTVGSGVVEMIAAHREKIMIQAGCDIEIKRILVHDLTRYKKYEADYALTTEVSEILNDPEITIIIEVMGGVEQTKMILLDAFENKKSVVSANKDLIAIHGEELSQKAKESGCGFYYEAAVAGGIPILQTLNHGLAIENFTHIFGILNGTTNYILTQMAKQHVGYDEALQAAQKAGFAEADPSGDVEGIDAARKVAIIARLAHLMPVVLSDVRASGITKITKTDIETAARFDCRIKLIGQIVKTAQGLLHLSVEPTFISQNHPLAHIDNEFNAVILKGDATKEIMLSGPGAGSLPTANAVMSDVITLIRNMTHGENNVVSAQKEKRLSDGSEVLSKYIMILRMKDVIGVFADVSQIFARYHLSFSQILQDETDFDGNKVVSVITHDTKRADIDLVIEKLKTVNHVEIESCYPMLGGK